MWPLALMLFAAAITHTAAAGAADSDSPPLHEVVITATRIEADPFNIPAAISSVSAEQLRNDALGVTGLKPGRTLCGYWGARPRYLLFTVTVVP